MPQTRTYNRSFAGGEVSPEMWGRLDDIKFQTGAATMRNFIATPQGPAENRAGTAFVREVKDSTKRTRLIPFTFSTTQTMVLEMGLNYFRFHTQGATLGPGSPAAYVPGTTVTITQSQQATVTITIASPGVVTWTGHTLSNGDRVILSTTGALPTGLSPGVVYYVVNSALNTFRLSLTSGGTAIDTTGSQSGTHTASTPTVINWSGHGLANGAEVGFTTTGSLPTGMLPDTVYYVINAATNTFEIATAAGGIPIVTSSAGSGVHTGATPYAIGSLVSSGGVNYYCIAKAINKTPPNATYWYPLPAGIYEIPTPYAEADLFDIHYVQSADVLTLVHPNYAPRELRRLGPTTWTLTTINFAASVTAPTGVTATLTGLGSGIDYSYVVTAVADDDVSESVQSSSATVSVDWANSTPGFVTVAWTAVAGASRYNVYKLQGGLYGFIGQTASTSINDDNIAPDTGITPPVYDSVFNSSNNYPGAVSYFEQRRLFAGTNNAPQTIWMTKSGTESDMSYSIPTEDTDRIKFRVAAREANTIRHLVPLTQLLALTSAAEWRISPVNSDVITPTTISVRPQSYVGASNVQPSIVNNTVVYGSARDGHVRELGYSWQASGFVTGDLSLRATHLFDGLSITDMCYSKAPHPLLWFISSNGDMLGLTYIPEQQVAAWHRHDTDGDFESCTAVAEGTEDALYVIVKRTIGGNTKRYVERFATRAVSTLENCFHVDSGLTYNGTNTTATTVTVTGGTAWTPAEVLTITASSAIFQFPATTDVGDVIVLTGADGTKYRLTILSTTSTTVATARVDKTLAVALRGVATAVWAWARDTVSGLSHLEGKTVSVLGDGAVMPQVVVTGGSVTIQRPSTIITVGLPYESDLQTLPLTLQIEAFGQGRAKNINEAFVRVYRSSGLFVGPSENKLVEAKWRTTEPYGSPPSLKTDEVGVKLTPTWQQNGQIYVRQVDPLPLTIVGLTLEVAIGG